MKKIGGIALTVGQHRRPGIDIEGPDEGRLVRPAPSPTGGSRLS
jgi:hypothetical protein